MQGKRRAKTPKQIRSSTSISNNNNLRPVSSLTVILQHLSTASKEHLHNSPLPPCIVCRDFLIVGLSGCLSVRVRTCIHTCAYVRESCPSVRFERLAPDCIMYVCMYDMHTRMAAVLTYAACQSAVQSRVDFAVRGETERDVSLTTRGTTAASQKMSTLAAMPISPFASPTLSLLCVLAALDCRIYIHTLSCSREP